MSTISQELERTAHDLMTGPSFRDNAEIAIAGGLLGGLLGYLKHRNRAEATRYATWGAGIGICSQYLVFHMLKPSMRQYASSSIRAAALGGGHFHAAGAPEAHESWNAPRGGY